MRSKVSIGRAPGKLILTGEHFVVLGAPALSMAIDLHSTACARSNKLGRVDVNATVPLKLVDPKHTGTEGLLEPLRMAALTAMERAKPDRGMGVHVDVECDIPIGAGLGSSASTSVAIIAAVAMAHGVRLQKREIFNLAYKPETLIHTKPSGVDQATTTFGGIIQYTSPGDVDRVKVKVEPPILVCDTGVHRSTGRLVGGVVDRSKRQKGRYKENVQRVAEITRSARRAFEKADFEELGLLMNRNQELLSEIGVSHPSLDRLIKAAREQGALGAKLTGAGGGGCMIALCNGQSSKRRIAKGLSRLGGTIYNTRLEKYGVRILQDSR